MRCCFAWSNAYKKNLVARQWPIKVLQVAKQVLQLPYSEKLSWEKTFTNFAIYSHSRKFSPQNFRHATPIYAISLTFHEMLSSYRSVKLFSLESFPLYSITRITQEYSRYRNLLPSRSFVSENFIWTNTCFQFSNVGGSTSCE